MKKLNNIQKIKFQHTSRLNKLQKNIKVKKDVQKISH